MSRRLSALLIWSCVAAAAVFWSLRLLASALPVPPSARLATAASAQSGDWQRLLGGAPKASEPALAVAAASRFRLAGVAAAGAGTGGAVEVALISVDGKPARAFRVGQRVDGDYVLRSVALRGATLTLAGAGAAGESLELELPEPVPAATSVLPAAMAPVLAPSPAVTPPAPAPGAEAPAPPQTPDLRGSPLAR